MAKSKTGSTAIAEKEMPASEEATPKTGKKKAKKEWKTVDGPKALEDVQLPKEVLDRKIVARSVIPSKDYGVNVAEIVGTSKCMYVNDIHDMAPVILATIYWLRLKDNPHVIVRCTEDDYQWAIDNLRITNANHLISVVDCSINPTISYGWQLDKLKGLPLPSLDMIKAYEDSHFKNNPTYFHNQKIVAVLKDKPKQTGDPDEDEFEFADEEEFEVEAIVDDAAATKEDSDEDEFDWTDE